MIVYQHVIHDSGPVLELIGPFRLRNRSDLIFPMPTWEEREYKLYPNGATEIIFTILPNLFSLISIVSSLS